jgi:hypothetical protein
MTWDEIRQLVVNPQTGFPINKTTLGKALKRELAVGRARHKSLIATGYYAALRAREPWALQLGLRTQFGWRPDGAAVEAVPDWRTGSLPSTLKNVRRVLHDQTKWHWAGFAYPPLDSRVTWRSAVGFSSPSHGSVFRVMLPAGHWIGLPRAWSPSAFRPI